jgi:hypothetical protein
MSIVWIATTVRALSSACRTAPWNNDTVVSVVASSSAGLLRVMGSPSPELVVHTPSQDVVSNVLI